MDIIKILQLEPKDYILFGSIILVLLAIVLTVFFLASKKKKSNQLKGSEFGDKLLTAFGGAENIKKIKLSRRRMKVEVYDINVIQLRLMKELKLGAMVTKEIVTVLIKDNSKAIYEYVEKKRKEVNKWKKHS